MTQINERKELDGDRRAFELIRQTRLANIAKLANMLIDLFGIPEAFEKYVKPKREGQIVELEFPALDGSVYIPLTRDKNKFKATYGKPPDSKASLIFAGEGEKMGIVLGKLIRGKSNIFGLLSLVPKLITRKIKIKGSFFTAIALARVMMIGKHPVYKDKEVLEK